MAEQDLIRLNENGLYCEAGGFYIDPWRPVDRAIITHAHSDHARRGHQAILSAASGLALLRHRLGSDARLEGIRYGEKVSLGRTTISLHPAGHILGSAQVRVECGGEIWVVSGDYKLGPDPTCEPFDPVTCHVFISECTFGLPVYQWPEPASVFEDINTWWRSNQDQGKTSLLFAYALGKTQRLLAGVDPGIGPIGLHGAALPFSPFYRAAGVALPEAQHLNASTTAASSGRGLILAPGSAAQSPWARALEKSSKGGVSTAFASGWMRVRGARRRQALDRGFILSDHADWPGLLTAIKASGASRIGLTHGQTGPFLRYLREHMGLDAFDIPTRFTGETPTAEEDS